MQLLFRGHETLEKEKSWCVQHMNKVAQSVPPWVAFNDILEASKKMPELHPLRIPVVLPNIGWVGDVIPGYGFAPLIQGGAITTYDGIINARAGGNADDYGGVKLSQGAVANQWSSFFRSGGQPGAGSYTNIPGGAVHNRASAGAWPLKNPSGADKKYLLTLGVNHGTGTNIVLLIDLLVAAGNINANATGNQTVNSTALTRYSGTAAAGNMIILEVTTGLGVTASNFNVNSYTNEAGTTGRATGNNAMTTSCITYRLQPTTGSYLIPLQADDLGVRSVETVVFSAAMGAGVVAILIFRPLMFIPTIATTTYVERDSTLQVDGLTELVLGSDSEVGCLTFLILTGSNATGVQTYFIRTCSG